MSRHPKFTKVCSYLPVICIIISCRTPNRARWRVCRIPTLPTAIHVASSCPLPRPPVASTSTPTSCSKRKWSSTRSAFTSHWFRTLLLLFCVFDCRMLTLKSLNFFSFRKLSRSWWTLALKSVPWKLFMRPPSLFLVVKRRRRLSVRTNDMNTQTRMMGLIRIIQYFIKQLSFLAAAVAAGTSVKALSVITPSPEWWWQTGDSALLSWDCSDRAHDQFAVVWVFLIALILSGYVFDGIAYDVETRSDHLFLFLLPETGLSTITPNSYRLGLLFSSESVSFFLLSSFWDEKRTRSNLYAPEENSQCSTTLTPNLNVGTGYRLTFTNIVNYTDVFATSEAFEIKPKGST